MAEQSIEVLLDQCRSGDPSQQVAAIHALLERKAYTAVSTLVGLLRSPDAVVRSTAAQALGHLGIHEPETVGPALLNLLVDPEVIVRSEAVDALGVLGYAPAVEAVKSVLRTDPEPLVRASAAETLGDLGDARALAEIELALHDVDDAVRAYAASSMGLLGTPPLLPKLQTYVEAEHSLTVKAELLGARYRLSAAEDLKQLLGLLDTADETLATVILNLLTDLTERKVPRTLAADAPHIRKALTALAQRIPMLHPHAEQIKAQIAKLESEIK